ncbi:MAG: HAMP domain-containing histidine kinase, partial [Nitrospirae bacterium]|nr:HAMP domain-containing histidine kinase [Nitrospirota bacterium]
ISSSTARIDYLSKAILNLSRLGFVELTFVTIDMESLVDSIIKTLTHQISYKKVKIVRVQKLPLIIADRTSMEQIISNIVDNAVKYLVNGRQGIIEINAAVTSKETIFHIKDNGRGISPSDSEKVFAVFRRAGIQDVAGEGMGLSYAKTLIRRHNGQIWFDSIEGQGTTFSFSIPKGLK